MDDKKIARNNSKYIHRTSNKTQYLYIKEHSAECERKPKDKSSIAEYQVSTGRVIKFNDSVVVMVIADRSS